MNKNVYDQLTVTLKDENDTYACDGIIDFDECDDCIIIDSTIQIEIKRGWIGDLSYCAFGFNIEDNNKIVTSKYLPEVLLARITISALPGSPVVWRYTFLKD